MNGTTPNSTANQVSSGEEVHDITSIGKFTIPDSNNPGANNSNEIVATASNGSKSENDNTVMHENKSNKDVSSAENLEQEDQNTLLVTENTKVDGSCSTIINLPKINDNTGDHQLNISNVTALNEGSTNRADLISSSISETGFYYFFDLSNTLHQHYHTMHVK